MKEYLVYVPNLVEDCAYVKANSPYEAKKLALEGNLLMSENLTMNKLKARECKFLSEREAQVRDEHAEWFHWQ